MVRNYKRKTTRGNYGDENLKLALQAVRNGTPVLRAAQEFGVPPRTIRRHRDGKVSNPGSAKLGRHRIVLTAEIEKELHDHIQYMEKALYGLTTRDIRRLAYEIAEKTGFQHPFNQDNKMAGKGWLSGFLSRHKDLSIREPQATNLSRAVGFNKPRVQQFFTVYRELLKAQEFTPSRVWNMDETGITNVHKPGKVLATKGVRQVGKMTSGERGKTVTVICGMNASGGYIPPMMIFPRKRMVDTLMAGAPPQSVGFASPSGWTDSELFIKWLEHFVIFTNASPDVEYIIILDGHHSHKTLAAVNYAREHGIHLLTLPPHCTHKMQPLDRTYFKSLKTAYNASADSWMVANPGKRISFFNMAGIFGKAYLRSATPDKAVQGFAVCGIWPYDNNIFSDSDFAASVVTNETEPSEPLPHPDALHVTLNPANNDGPSSSTTGRLCVEAAPAVVSTSSSIEEIPVACLADGSPHSDNIDHRTNITVPTAGPAGVLAHTDDPTPVLNQSESAVQSLIHTLSPIPKLTTSRSRKRKSEGATLLTSSPFKNLLLEKEAMKASKGKAKGRESEVVKSQGSIKGKSRVCGKGKGKAKSSAKKGTNRKRNNDAPDDSSDDEEWPCLICGEPYSNSRSKEVWIQCMSCEMWAHEECTAGERLFVCPNCDSEIDSVDSDD